MNILCKKTGEPSPVVKDTEWHEEIAVENALIRKLEGKSAKIEEEMTAIARIQTGKPQF